jgi:hypothetical protein
MKGRVGDLLGKVLGTRPKQADGASAPGRARDGASAESSTDEHRPVIEPRQASECEIDEAVDESFPASDPPALGLEKDR